MSSIGALSFRKMWGPQVPTLAAAVELIDRPGRNGTAYRVPAFKAEEITKYTEAGYELLASANSAADVYAALKGYKVTIVDDLGRTVPYVLVVDVRVTGVRSQKFSSPAGHNYIVYAVWLLKPTL